MTKNFISLSLALGTFAAAAQGPAVTSWLQNTTQLGTYYVSGNSTALVSSALVNCQQIEYSATSVYIAATGVPAYPTGPFLDGNPSLAEDQNGLYKLPLNPQQNTGTPIATNGGNIGLFINGVALFDYRDGVGWNSNTNSLCGGPGNPPCPGGPMAGTDWSRDAIPAEMGGFDCSKAHPAMGNYHHHQNPSAFKLDLNVVSTICNMYDADGLYAIDSTQHSPLIGFAYDGFPIYGAYGYANADGTGGITRIKSSYELASYTVRTHHPDGTDVDDGPPVSATYPLGYFKDDYMYVAQTGEDYLDEHNGRFCVTPEYPDTTYAYFATVDQNWNSTYPYVVGPTFYGNATNASINSITEPTTVYTSTMGITDAEFEQLDITVFPNPTSDLIAIQANGLLRGDLQINLYDQKGSLVQQKSMLPGTTIQYLDTRLVYPGQYQVEISNGTGSIVKQVVVLRE